VVTLKLQNIIFPTYGLCSENDLYFRISNETNYSYTGKHIYFNDGDWTHFDTYFNALFVEKWKKYTGVESFRLNLKLKGAFRVTLLQKERLENGECTNSKIFETEVSSDDYKWFSFDYPNSRLKGMYTFSLYSLSNKSFFKEGYYSGKINKEPDIIKLGVCICTFKREEYVRKNLKNLLDNISQKDSDLYKKILIYVSDNAQTLQIPENDDLKIFKNKNTGGAGGFTRCLIEVLKNQNENQLTHVVMMDDDIIFDVESIFRTCSMLSILKPEYKNSFIGGAMLRTDRPYIQTESGAIWNDGELVSLKSGLNLKGCEACLFNEIEESCEYNAWWYCVMPISVVREDNLPLPIFIRGDDVEYGLRNSNHIILMSGICVWHEPFENKYSSSMYYYIFRNRLIDNSVREIEYPLKKAKADFMTLWRNEIYMYRYKNAELLLMGLRDYLKGIDWLLSEDGEKLHKKVMNMGYKLENIENIHYDFTYSDYIQPKNVKKRRLVVDITKNGLILKPTHDVVVSVFFASPDEFFRVGKAMNYDYNSRRGFLTYRDKTEYKRQKSMLKKELKNLKKRYYDVKNEYKERRSELYDLSFWQKYLNLES
jgi:galactofuranosylgalactofuranosylrhamnosyl-N-acetylglucosaminyl-diphospho-decaprenol beta-1,5/1,6-galactofuranosyltransferase